MISSYSDCIRAAFGYLLANDDDVFVMGQGLWSPWYVGNSMKELDKEFGINRVIDTPVSESLSTGACVGAAISGMRPIVVHPRMDFMIYAMDSIVNQAAKWSYMFSGNSNAPVTIRTIINRGGEQGAQHSQSLQSWFAHIPGLRVVMPYTPQDARDLLIASVYCNDPVIYIDDRWLYEEKAEVENAPSREISLNDILPQLIQRGNAATVVASSYGVKISLDVLKRIAPKYACDLIDLRIISPLKENAISIVRESVKKTGRLIVVDAAWAECGVSAEIVSRVCESVSPDTFRSSPQRVTLPDCSAPCAANLESAYYDLGSKLEKLLTGHESSIL